ncbi:MAG: putative serine protease PepD [Mycobacterium sp.]|nr:putative serine protease PepD [Mycobacterium sp.]
MLPSVVTLQEARGERSELGSGIILSSDGLIMTTNSVLAGIVGRPEAVQTSVRFSDGRTAPFEVVATDPRTDVAVVWALGVSRLTPITFGSSADLLVGQPVAAVGSPLGLTATVTLGVISALNRPVLGPDFTAFDAIQTDAALNPGNSGGALVDKDGKLVGMNSATGRLAGNDRRSGSIGIGFAIPADQARRIASELIATGSGSHAWLGTETTSESNSRGARIMEVRSGSPAAAAGLCPGALVTRFDNVAIGSSGGLVAAVQSTPPGATVSMGFIDSSGDETTVQVVLGSDQGRR